MGEQELIGTWRYVVELRRIPFLKKPLAALGKKLNEGIRFEFKPDGMVDIRLGSMNQPAKWTLDGDRISIDTGNGPPSVGAFDSNMAAFEMECADGSFGDELKGSSIRLVRA